MDRKTEVSGEHEPAETSMIRANSTWWCRRGHCTQMTSEEESLCCAEWDQVLPSVQLEVPVNCVAATDALDAIIHPSVVDFSFRRDKINWKRRHTPSGPDGQLSSE